VDTSLDEDYVYNANGDLIVKKEENETILWTYSYTVEGWLEKVEGPSGFVEEYEYDPTGRKYKVETTEDQQTTTRYLVYDGGSVILELDEDEELSKEFVRGLSLGGGIGGLLYVRDADESVSYFHYDGQGNVVSVTDESRTEVAYYEYDAWGNILTSCGSLSNEFRFSTKQGSLGTGLIDFGYRWYDPSVGRWTQRDPIGVSGGVNLYVYAYNAPTCIVDPLGLKVRKVGEGHYTTVPEGEGPLGNIEDFLRQEAPNTLDQLDEIGKSPPTTSAPPASTSSRSGSPSGTQPYRRYGYNPGMPTIDKISGVVSGISAVDAARRGDWQTAGISGANCVMTFGKYGKFGGRFARIAGRFAGPVAVICALSDLYTIGKCLYELGALIKDLSDLGPDAFDVMFPTNGEYNAARLDMDTDSAVGDMISRAEREKGGLSAGSYRFD